MSQHTLQSPVNFNHRITGTETEELFMTDLTAQALSETIGNMTDRATSTVNLLLPSFDASGQEQPDIRTIYFALNSIIMELADVQKTVEAFALANKKKNPT